MELMELKKVLQPVVIADGAPAILRAIQEICEEHKDSLQAEVAAAGWPQYDGPDGEYVTPLWLWWSMFGSQFDYCVRDLEKRIEERTLTRDQLNKKWSQAELNRKREELQRMENAAR